MWLERQGNIAALLFNFQNIRNPKGFLIPVHLSSALFFTSQWGSFGELVVNPWSRGELCRIALELCGCDRSLCPGVLPSPCYHVTLNTHLYLPLFSLGWAQESGFYRNFSTCINKVSAWEKLRITSFRLKFMRLSSFPGSVKCTEWSR